MKKGEVLDWLIVAAAFLLILVSAACQPNRPHAAAPPVPYNEAMGEMSSKGTALLLCIEDRIEMVCHEMGAESSECSAIRMANYSQMFDRIKSVNRCLDRMPDSKQDIAQWVAWSTDCPMAVEHSRDQLRTLFLRDIEEAVARCNTIEDDHTIQSIIDEAFRRKMKRLAMVDQLERAGIR